MHSTNGNDGTLQEDNGSIDLEIANPNSNPGPSTSVAWDGPGPEFGIGNKNIKIQKKYKNTKSKKYTSTHVESNEGKGNDGNVCNDDEALDHQNPNSNKGLSTSAAWERPGLEFGIGNKNTKIQKKYKTINHKKYTSTHVESNKGKESGDKDKEEGNVENSVDKTSNKTRNKIMHTLNGNIKSKQRSHIKIIQVNTGIGKFETSRTLLRKTILDNDPGVTIVSESNMMKNEPDLKTDFEKYKFESKYMGNMDKARMTVIIRSDINFTRLHDLEEDDVSAIFIKVKITKKKSLIIMCMYRQWALPSELNSTSIGLPGQLERFDQITKKLSDLKRYDPHRG